MGVFFLWLVLIPGDANSFNNLQLNNISAKRSISDFSGEKLVYDISFLWFKNAAEGSIILQKDNDGHIAKLLAQTKGFIGFLTGFVKHFYISHMKVVGENTGLQPYLFEKNITYLGDEEKVITSLDYEKRIMSWTKTSMGKLIEEKSEPIPLSTIYYDILSAFYNLRSGYYGEIEKGKDFLINTIPEKNETKIHIHVCTKEEELKLKKEEKIEDVEGYFFIVKVPKEIFKTKEGEVFVWANKALLPLNVILRDYIGFGDVKGKLREVLNVDT